jgi:glycine cleavage system aminomethyltransferase T
MLLYGGETITCRDKVVGVVSSGGFGHTVGKTISMGYLSTEDSQVAEGYAVEVFGESFPASRLAKAPYDPERRKIFL